MFNKKIISAVSVLLCGVFMLSVVWEPSTVKAKGSARHSATAGIVSALADAEKTNGNATAGIVTALSVNVDDAGALYAQESGNQAVSSTVEEYGYTNMGIAILSEGGNLNVREEPSTDGHIVGKLPDKGGCEVLSIEDGWAKISSGKVEGYVSTEFLKTGEEAVALANELAQLVATVTGDGLRIRQEPSTDSPIIINLSSGEKLEVVEDMGDWIKVSVDGEEEGYVSAEYVRLAMELQDAMTLSEIRYGEGVSDVRVDLVNYALQFVGNPYVWGGTSLTKGADCSGFVLSIYAKYGYGLPHSSRAQAGYGRSISASEAKPGDLFFYGGGGISHVAIYIGNGQIVHASNRRTGIKISNAFYRTPKKVVSILG